LRAATIVAARPPQVRVWRYAIDAERAIGLNLPAVVDAGLAAPNRRLRDQDDVAARGR
jgi:hypothetical protein